MQAFPFVIYGGDTLQDGTQCGVETKRRRDRAVNFFKTHGDRFFIILAANKRPDKPSYPPLKEVMRNSLVEKLRVEGFCSGSFLITQMRLAKKDAWSTFEETVATLDEIKQLGARKVYVCSSWYHIPRIWFIWRLLDGWKKQIVFIPAPSPLQWKTLIWEIFGFMKVFRRWYNYKTLS